MPDTYTYENWSAGRLHEIAAEAPSSYSDDVAREAKGLRARMPALDEQRRRVLLVGGAGYIGAEVTAHLLERGYAVRCLDLLLYENGLCVTPFLRHPNYDFVQGDLSDRATVEHALEGVCDVVCLAALVGDPITKKYPDASKAINETGTFQLLDCCNGRGLNKVIFISTCSNYGMIEGNHLADEDHELKPMSLYASAKVAAEEKLLTAKGAVDYTPTVLRFATAFGISVRMRFDLTISEFTRAMFRKEPVLVYDADTWRPYCHVSDFARAITRVLEAPAERVAFNVFNAGGDINNYTKQMIVDEILALLPNAEVAYKEQGQDPRNYRVDFRRIREQLHFEPHFCVGDGVDELVVALRSGLFGNVEQNMVFHGNYELNYAP